MGKSCVVGIEIFLEDRQIVLQAIGIQIRLQLIPVRVGKAVHDPVCLGGIDALGDIRRQIGNLLGILRSFRIPMARADLVELARKNGTIEKEEWLEDVISLEARIPGSFDDEGKATTRTLALLKDYIA